MNTAARGLVKKSRRDSNSFSRATWAPTGARSVNTGGKYRR